MFEGDYKLVHHLAPPLTARKDAQGHLVKKAYAPRVRSLFKLLAGLKGLRGSMLDVFGRNPERQTERALIAEYRACIEGLLPQLTADKLDLAVQIARSARRHSRLRPCQGAALQAARAKWQGLMQQWQTACGRAAPGVTRMRGDGRTRFRTLKKSIKIAARPGACCISASSVFLLKTGRGKHWQVLRFSCGTSQSTRIQCFVDLRSAML